MCPRIGTATPEPIDFRSLSTWICPRDLLQLVTRALLTPGVGFLVAFGMSGNTRAWWDPQPAWRQLGCEPQDDAEAYVGQVSHLRFEPGSAPARLQGGVFLDIGPFPHLPPFPHPREP